MKTYKVYIRTKYRLDNLLISANSKEEVTSLLSARNIVIVSIKEVL